MKIKIDGKICLKHKLTFEEAVTVLAVKSCKDYISVLDNLVNRGVIVLDEGKYVVNKKWSDEVDKILYESSGDILDDEKLTELASKIMECFPKQKMRDRFGRETPYYFRCNKPEIRGKLKRFFEKYGYYSDEDIIDATKRYVAEYAKKGYAGMRLAKYFIWKDDVKLSDDEHGHIEPISDLLTYLSNKDTEDYNEDWTSHLV